MSAISRVPWPKIAPLTSVWGLIGVCGALYAGIVVRRMQSQSAYQPGFEDWLFHTVLPFTAYVLLVFSAVRAISHARGALFGIGAAGLLLLFSGIHNAWDAVAYHVMANIRRQKE